jgi:hypothetical protein
LFLKTEKRGFRKSCCDAGRLNNESNMPTLGCLPPVLKRTAIDNLTHFTRNSVSYNSVLSLGATGVENHTPEHPGWERIHGGDTIYTIIQVNSV